MIRALLIVFCVGFFPAAGKCQLMVVPEKNADSLAKGITGSGLTLSNIVLNCPDSASGIFDGTGSNIGISKGILLTTGKAMLAVGPNNVASAGFPHNINFSDPDLTALEPLATFDACILEFDALVDCDSMYVKFVFGSEEYPEYVNAGFNDVFGIFVTGPNPSGPPYSGYNMTTIPSSANFVSINNVNNGTVCPTAGPCMNCTYYVDNCTGTSVQYDGFTTVITKTLYVIPGQSYHYKFAVADAGDGIFDTGVFFGLGSFACLNLSAGDDLLPEVRVNVSPNPVRHSAVFSFDGIPAGPVSVLTIRDVFGRKLKSEKVDPGTDCILNPEGLSGGCYFYYLETGGSVIASGKLMVQ